MNNLIGGKPQNKQRTSKSARPASGVHLRTTKSKTLHKANRVKQKNDINSPKTAKVKTNQKVDLDNIDSPSSSKVERFNVKHEFSPKTHTPKKKPTKKGSLTNTQKKDHIIKQALNSAKSPSHRLPKKIKLPRLSTVATSAAAAVLLFGYITYLNIPNISLRVAASRAGIDAELPEYNPPGFKFEGPVAYSSGEISLKYQASDNNSRSYSLIQKKSNWDSQSLLTNYVEEESSAHEAHSRNGLTIYTLDDTSATWVNAGVWYTINDNAELSSEQLLNIATSI